MHGDPATRLRVALELHDLGEQIQRQRLRRERPSITTAELDQAVAAWLRERPGAEHGDAIGRSSSGPPDAWRPRASGWSREARSARVSA